MHCRFILGVLKQITAKDRHWGSNTLLLAAKPAWALGAMKMWFISLIYLTLVCLGSSGLTGPLDL